MAHDLNEANHEEDVEDDLDREVFEEVEPPLD